MIGNDFWRAVATHRPEVAGLFGYSMQSIGDGGSYLGEIVETDEHNGTRSVQIDHPVHGRMTIRQEQDRTTESYRNLDVTFVDPETGEEITEKLPSSRFFVRVSEGTHAQETEESSTAVERVSPEGSAGEGGQSSFTPAEDRGPLTLPNPVPDQVPPSLTPPFQPGEGRDLIPNHTGGNQVDSGAENGLIEEFQIHEPEPQIHITPDDRHAERFPSVLYVVTKAKDLYGSQPVPELLEAFKDIEIQTGLKVHPRARRMLIKILRKRSFWNKRTKKSNEARRKKFEKNRAKIRKKWEEKTKQIWPFIKEEVFENGVKKERIIYYDAHHIIPLSVGGPWDKWWNVHPARSPDQHQGGVHRSKGPLNRLTK